jgi:uncharacterized protein YjdB
MSSARSRNEAASRRRYRSVRRLAAAGFTLGVVWLGACKTPTPSCAVSSVTVTPGAADLTVGETEQLQASVSASNCSETPATTWISSAAGVATVSATGLVTAAGAGTATISATAGGVSGTALVTVTQAAIATLEIQPAAGNVAVNGTLQLTAIARDAGNAVLTGRTFTWVSLSPAVVSVNASGLVTGLTPGQGSVSVSAEGRSALATVTVNPPPVASVTVALNENNLSPGQTTQAIATLRDAQGATLTNRAITWNSSSPGVASVDQFGAITANAPGQTTITATSEGQSGQAVLTVTQIAVASIALSVPSSVMQAGGVQNAIATARAANGSPLQGRLIVWTSSNQAVAQVSQTGTITAVAAGVAVISVTCEGQFAVAAITVTNAVASIDLVLDNAVIQVGQNAQASATARDGNGAVLAGVPIVLGIANPALASISGTGLITALAAGATTVTATAGAIVANTPLTVNPAVVPVASVVVTPAAQTINTGASVQLTGQPKDAGGQNLAGRIVTWESSANTIASVSNTGLVTGVAAGVATITATSEGVQGMATITVQQAPVATVTVTATASTASVGQQVIATAVTKDGGGNTLTGRTIVWSSSSPTVAGVDQAGLITTVSAGQTTITATSEGKSGSVVITVTEAAVLSVSSHTPNDAEANVGIETGILITFSDNIDPSTVSAASVMLTNGGAVAATRTVSGKTITITPSAPLTEYNTVYQVTITTAVKSFIGSALPGTAQFSFSTVFWDPDYYYKLTNDFNGPGFALDTYSGGGYECFMGVNAGFSGQYWLFSFIGMSGTFYMSNLFGGELRGLEGAGPPGPCFLSDAPAGTFTGMMWYPKAVPGQPGKYYLSSLNGGDTRALAGGATPFLDNKAADPKQYWTFTRQFRK